jgi:chemotaxis methyl-accepting protein methylase
MAPQQDESLIQIKNYLKTKGIHDTYKHSYFLRRINIRLRKTGTSNLKQYYGYLRAHPGEIDLLKKDLSINVTKFFRDADSFDYFCQTLTKLMIDNFKSRSKKTIKIWSAGCAIGAEPYSIAIHVDKTIQKYNLRGLKIVIYATDFNQELLSYARRAIYESSLLENIDRADRQNYFDNMANFSASGESSIDEQYRVSYKIKKFVEFSHFDLTKEFYPFKQLDAIICRNVLIYFNTESQFNIFKKFYDSLKDGGYLFLGRTETLHLGFRGHFKNISPKHRLYTKISSSDVAIDEIIKCDICSLSFTREIDFSIHKNIHNRRKAKKDKLVAKNEFKYKGKLIYCKYCDKSFITQRRYLAHLKLFHKVFQSEKNKKTK